MFKIFGNVYHINVDQLCPYCVYAEYSPNPGPIFEIFDDKPLDSELKWGDNWYTIFVGHDIMCFCDDAERGAELESDLFMMDRHHLGSMVESFSALRRCKFISSYDLPVVNDTVVNDGLIRSFDDDKEFDVVKCNNTFYARLLTQCVCNRVVHLDRHHLGEHTDDLSSSIFRRMMNSDFILPNMLSYLGERQFDCSCIRTVSRILVDDPLFTLVVSRGMTSGFDRESISIMSEYMGKASAPMLGFIRGTYRDGYGNDDVPRDIHNSGLVISVSSVYHIDITDDPLLSEIKDSIKHFKYKKLDIKIADGHLMLRGRVSFHYGPRSRCNDVGLYPLVLPAMCSLGECESIFNFLGHYSIISGNLKSLFERLGLDSVDDDYSSGLTIREPELLSVSVRDFIFDGIKSEQFLWIDKRL